MSQVVRLVRNRAELRDPDEGGACATKDIVSVGGLLGDDFCCHRDAPRRFRHHEEMLNELMVGNFPVPKVTREMLNDLLALNRVQVTLNRRLKGVAERSVCLISINGKGTKNRNRFGCVFRGLHA